MRRVLAVAVAAAWVMLAGGAGAAGAQADPAPANAPEQFRDLPAEHWAYGAADSLQKIGVLVGYPDGFFRGKRTLTRYEFAVALRRALDWTLTHAKGEKGDPGEAGPVGPAGAGGPAGRDGSDAGLGALNEDLGKARAAVGELQRLAAEFRAELERAGAQIAGTEKQLAALAKDLQDMKAAWDGAVKVRGELFLGVRSDRAAGPYVDFHGIAHDRNLTDTALTLHQLRLSFQGRVGPSATIDAKIVAGNYNNYPQRGYQPEQVPAPSGNVYMDQLQIAAPFTALGVGGRLSIGRLTEQISPLTLWKGKLDRYFENPIQADNLFRMDGFRMTTHLGSAGVELFAGQTGNYRVRDETGAPIQRTRPGGNINQIGGLNVTAPLALLGRGASARATAYLGTDAAGYNMAVLGAGGRAALAGRLSLAGEWAKYLRGQGKRYGSVVSRSNQAFTGAFEYASGPTALGLGYRYIEPAYRAPGYWSWTGRVMNLTNVQGPTVTLIHNLSPAFGVDLGCNVLETIHGQSGSRSPRVTQALAKLRWDLSAAVRLTLDADTTFWAAQKTADDGVITTHPTESYVTLGAVCKLSDAATMKLSCQLGAVRTRSDLPAYNEYSFTVLTSQLFVRF